MDEVRVKESSLQDIADAIREKTGEAGSYRPANMGEAIRGIEIPTIVVEPLQITANGEYKAPEGVTGYSPVNVEVEPETEELIVTENGEYIPATDGYSKVTVNCPAPPTDEELVVTGDCTRRFSNNGWNWVIEKHGDRITTKDITLATNMFSGSDMLSEIPFDININTYSVQNMFSGCTRLKASPKIRGNFSWATSTNFNGMLSNTYNVRVWEDLFTPEMLEGYSTVKVTGSYSSPQAPIFRWNHSLRTVPSWWYKFKLNPESTAYPASSYGIYYSTFYECYALNEALNIPVWKCAAAQTSNMFATAFDNCRRISNLTFETNPDGTPIVTEWKSQTIDLSICVGYEKTAYAHGYNSEAYLAESKILQYNSGITEDKLVHDDATYQALKNDPDWWSAKWSQWTGAHYSRYNHDSAVATINSLPDTSAYLATAGGTNTIKFEGASGSLTDGGAINTLTEEEIAVATAKGWTVTLV